MSTATTYGIRDESIYNLVPRDEIEGQKDGSKK